ncbi:MAG: flippase-like domain-containing protein [Candidatus Heimdallarchaeota archaeon]|nr:flippase-like domain-containing protein [Candidatus Heimdallarchaeota archaeon]MCK5049534.1 flippase-like domain-containing protein [Candidatus Heimdallarchaeota archaeon]
MTVLTKTEEDNYSPAKETNKLKQFIIIGLMIAVFLVMLLYTGIEKVYDAFLEIGLAGILLVFVIYFTIMLLRTLRWALFLWTTDNNLSFLYLFRVAMISWAQNAFLPARLGDVSRLVLPKKRYEVAYGTNLSLMIIEKVQDVISLFFILGVSAFLTVQTINLSDEITFWLKIVPIISILVIILIAVLTVLGQQVLDITLGKIAFFETLHLKLSNLYQNYREATIIYAKNRRILALTSLFAILVSFIEAIGIYSVIIMVGHSIPIEHVLLAASFGLLTFIFPLLPGSTGTFETAIAVGLVAVSSISKEDALLAPTIYHLLVIVFLAIGASIASINLELTPEAEIEAENEIE